MTRTHSDLLILVFYLRINSSYTTQYFLIYIKWLHSDFCFKLGSYDSHFNVSFIQWEANSHNSICKQELLKRKVSRSEESPALKLRAFWLPATNAILLGQTVSQLSICRLVSCICTTQKKMPGSLKFNEHVKGKCMHGWAKMVDGVNVQKRLCAISLLASLNAYSSPSPTATSMLCMRFSAYQKWTTILIIVTVRAHSPSFIARRGR